MDGLLDQEYPQEEMINEEVVGEEAYDTQSLVDNLLNKNQEQSTNLTNQRQIINEAYKENKALQNQIAELRKELESLKSNQSNYGYGLDQDTINELQNMRNQFQAMNIQRQREAIVPVLDTMRDMGVPLQNVEPIFQKVKEIYGVDLTVNPNPNLMRYAIQEQGWGTTQSQYMPRGGYYNQQEREAQLRQARETNYQAKLQAKMAELNAYAQSKKQR